jgi:ribose 5-phosphate isomerase B
MRVALAADHGGIDMKTLLAMRLAQTGHIVIDFGNTVFDPGDDYPDFAVPLARAVASGKVDRGVLICGSGVGASVVANKISGVRAALIHDQYSARAGVEHDNLNVLCLGARTTGVSIAWQCVVGFLGARFSGAPRHRRRLAKVSELEESLAITGT